METAILDKKFIPRLVDDEGQGIVLVEPGVTVCG